MKSDQALKQAAQGRDGITVTGRIQKHPDVVLKDMVSWWSWQC